MPDTLLGRLSGVAKIEDRVKNESGTRTKYSYDTLSRLTRLKADLGATPITDFQYSYDAAGNRTRKQQLDYTEDYSYDPLYRLTGVERSGGLTGIWHYGYDPVGNRTTAQVNNSVLTSAFNEKNQLTSSSGGGMLKVRGTLNEPGTAKVNGNSARMLAGNVFEATIQATAGSNTISIEAADLSGNVTTKSYSVDVSAAGASFGYDTNGNLISKTEGADTWTYEWNAENRLKRVLLNGSEVARFSYDPRGRRVERVAAGVTTSYLYDGEDTVREINSAASFRYVHGPAVDEALAREEDAATLTYFHADGLGSIVKGTNQAGAVVHENRYNAWGEIEAGSSEPGYAFTGREWDPVIGLYDYRARYYEPGVGRFIAEDGLKADLGLSSYMYVRNDPVKNSDPSGYCTCLFTGNVGKLTVDCSCKGILRLWVISETESPASGATAGSVVDADGYVLNGTTYKIDGSTCVEMNCTPDTVTVSACVNNMGRILGSTGPYPVPAGQFGGPPKEPPLGAVPPLVN